MVYNNRRVVDGLPFGGCISIFHSNSTENSYTSREIGSAVNRTEKNDVRLAIIELWRFEHCRSESRIELTVSPYVIRRTMLTLRRLHLSTLFIGHFCHTQSENRKPFDCYYYLRLSLCVWVWQVRKMLGWRFHRSPIRFHILFLILLMGVCRRMLWVTLLASHHDWMAYLLNTRSYLYLSLKMSGELIDLCHIPSWTLLAAAHFSPWSIHRCQVDFLDAFHSSVLFGGRFIQWIMFLISGANEFDLIRYRW